MAERDVSLTHRVENVREATPVVMPVQFELSQIKRHFDESLEAIKNQFEIADSLISNGKTEDGKTIYRSQIVFLEGILDEIYANVVMQDWETIRDQLNLFGVPWKEVCLSMFSEMDEKHAIDEGKKILTALYKRRNMIAHQNDRSHASAEQEDISKEYVGDRIREVESFVGAIHSIASQK